MPRTVNGIGTHYYGKKNLVTRVAVCKSCGSMEELASYDTRLWIVIAFIPVFSLGRKRILDLCPACSRHFAVKADEYEQARQLQTSGSLERFRREPSAATAAEAHGQLLGFHEHDQAAEFRREALDRFPGHAGLRAAMAGQLWEASGYEESSRLFEEALALDPGSPEARVGVARFKLAQGEHDEAEKLLDFLMQPGAGSQHSLAPLDSLSGAYQAVGRHAEALRVAEAILRELPAVGGAYDFRQFVRKSEKAVGRAVSVLPERPFSPWGLFRAEGSPYAPWQRRTAIGGVAAILIAGGLAANNEYIRRHRTLHVLNATGSPARVQVDDEPAVEVAEMGMLTVSEGPHVVKVSGPVEETRQVALESGYFERWTHSPAWILNPGGEAVVDELTIVYTAAGVPGRRDRMVGIPFIQRPHVDYLFTPAPREMRVEGRNREVVKTEIEWARGEDLEAFEEALQGDRAAALGFAESRLRRDPNRAELLESYLQGGGIEGLPRVAAFLKPGLDRRPVDIAWHRAYQAAVEASGVAAGLVPLYDAALAAAPSDAALLYLRGRIDPDWDAQAAFYRRSIDADPKLSWPHAALAGQAFAEARWDDCLAEAARARELDHPDRDRLAEMVHTARAAKGEASSLVEDARAEVAAQPLDARPFLRLVDALAAAGRGGEIAAEVGSWAARLPEPARGQAVPFLKAAGLYAAGELEACVADPALKTSPFRRQALLALGRVDEATDEATFGTADADPEGLLAIGVALGLAGRHEEAASRREQAAALVAGIAGATEFAKATAFLSAPEPPPARQVVRAHVAPEYKALLLASLAERFPADREAYLAEASRFNVLRKPAYHLIARAVAAKGDARP